MTTGTQPPQPQPPPVAPTVVLSSGVGVIINTAAQTRAPTISVPSATAIASHKKAASPRSGKKRPLRYAAGSEQQQQQQQQQTSGFKPQSGGVPPNRVGKDGEPLSEKKLRRLEKNRLSARECRRRKREATENMQGQINLLEGENLRLRLQLQVGEEAEQTNHQKQIDSTKALDELLKSGRASESEIYAKIEDYKEKFADYGRDRRSAMEFHLRNVERLLMPTQTTNFIMNTLKQGGGSGTSAAAEINSSGPSNKPAGSDAQGTTPEAVTSSAAKAPSQLPSREQSPRTSKELFTLLVKNLEVTPVQAAALKDSRFVAQEMDGTLKETLNVLMELRGRLAQCGQDLDTEFNCIRQILTPSQSAKFLVWVAQNKACMHMLNELWSKNYPSTIVNSPSSSTATTEPGSGSLDE